MKDKLIQWAKAGDGDCMYKLATLYREEGDFPQYVHWLEQSAATKCFDAMKEYAELLRGDGNYEKALEIYKELSKKFCDEEAMEHIVDMVERGSEIPKNDKDTLNFILNIIDEVYNEIYLIDRGNILARTITFCTRRHNECTWEYLRAVERRRIAARIRKLLAEDGGENNHE